MKSIIYCKGFFKHPDQVHLLPLPNIMIETIAGCKLLTLELSFLNRSCYVIFNFNKDRI